MKMTNPTHPGIGPLCILMMVCCGPLMADEALSFAHEGDAETRERLGDLQGAIKPPPLRVENWLNAEAKTLEDLKGKIVVLDFWATWCGPCIASIPHTNEMQEKYGPRGVVFIGVCHQRGAEKMGATVKERGIRYPVAADVEGKTVEAYKVNGFPDYYIIDRKGVLRVADCANAKVEEAVRRLLEE